MSHVYAYVGLLVEFYGCDPHVLLHALEILEQQGKATIHSGEDINETGVKFFEA